ncbi:MAG: CRISPR-associated endonuclease Cas1 [Magnetococcales bacterium]|nr:CRISPR-associated endonuclease Cas1 [Magnetococcales bacterium]MBF0440029.1 CRISPR-associated endonuclease Cas1 [Magnetococcales bacterium]
MPTLYVTEPGATVRFSGGVLHVTAAHESGEKNGVPRLLLKVEPHRLELVALVGKVHITVDALHLCLSKGIGVAWFAWNGHFLGRMVPEAARSGDLRIAQYRTMVDLAGSLDLARRVIGAKCGNAGAVLRTIQSNQPGLEDLSTALRSLAEQRERVADCGSVESLLGHEGVAASCYFGVLGCGFRGDIGFSGRQRRPPPDPANALLSFGYVLLGNLIAGYVEARGLDPSVGFFHAPRPGRASLALDLLEEFRHPVVDRFVMRVCNLRRIRLQMFEPDLENGGVRLTREGLKSFFQAWGEYLERPIQELNGEKLTPSALMRRQVNRMAMALRGEDPYQPFLLQD